MLERLHHLGDAVDYLVGALDHRQPGRALSGGLAGRAPGAVRRRSRGWRQRLPEIPRHHAADDDAGDLLPPGHVGHRRAAILYDPLRHDWWPVTRDCKVLKNLVLAGARALRAPPPRRSWYGSATITRGAVVPTTQRHLT